MPNKKTILIVDDNEVNRRILERILISEYDVILAENGMDALDILEGSKYPIACVVLDIIMPVMNGYEFLSRIKEKEKFNDLPVIVITGSNDQDSEKKVLQSGAWDFVSKPYNLEIVRFRIRNAIERSQLAAFERIKYLAEFDALTGIYNREKFYNDTHIMLQKYPGENFLFCRMDINRFQLINSYFGVPEGDRLLKYLSRVMRKFAAMHQPCVYGRIEGDVFTICCKYVDEVSIASALEYLQSAIKKYNISFDIVPTFGIYEIEDHSMAVDMMLDKANLAAKSIKGNYMRNYAIYTADMGQAIEKEQEITNEMNAALERHQFYIQIQPKYDLSTNLPIGGEALVRWNHPIKGRISPGDFIPIFEKNGFISKLDYYVWDETCSYLKKWRDMGKNPHPISVNVSRVNLYNPNIVDVFCELLKKYDLPASILQLELTESAYTDNPHVTQQVVHSLREHGFTILMDDFGSGYSSLNILKDIEVDILKIDTKFLAATKVSGRGENIIASVVRMAKWLNIPVVAEGVERIEQVEFLRGIGCEYVQGFYFGRPTDPEEYIELDHSNMAHKEVDQKKFDADSIWTSNPQMEMLFSNAMQAAAIYEYDANLRRLEYLRVNNAYYEIVGNENPSAKRGDPLSIVQQEYKDNVISVIQSAVDMKNMAECEFACNMSEQKQQWLNLKIKYISSMGNKHILFASLFDISTRKEIEFELEKYRNAIAETSTASNCMLIVDDEESNRAIIHGMFEERFTILEAANGKEALDVLEKHNYKVDIIMLDMIMPVMDGTAFLKVRRQQKDLADIPVVIMADETPERQINTLAIGANDYIIKPFIEEMVVRRVNNVLESSHRFRTILKEYQSAVDQAKADPLTHVYNRAAAQDIIGRLLDSEEDIKHALVMIDIDNYKMVNDSYGHNYGDKVLVELAKVLRDEYDPGDVIARMGGDEFCVFVRHINQERDAMDRAERLCKKIDEMKLGEANIRITCSVGIYVFEGKMSFDSMYKNADMAMYESKHGGKNRVTLYTGGESSTCVREGITSCCMGVLGNAVCAVDFETDEILYVSQSARDMFREKDCLGKKCYELMLGLDCACKNCEKAKLSEDSFMEMHMLNAYLGRRVVIHSRIIYLMGRKLQLIFMNPLDSITDA